jgi:hypothetical protein
MNQEKEFICYQDLRCKVYLKQSKLFEGNFDIIKLEDIHSEKGICYGIYSYVNIYVDYIKEKIIRHLTELNKVDIIIMTFDNNNSFHRLIINVTDMIKKIYMKALNTDYYKSIFIIIKYYNKIVFIGDINFDHLV